MHLAGGGIGRMRLRKTDGNLSSTGGGEKDVTTRLIQSWGRRHNYLPCRIDSPESSATKKQKRVNHRAEKRLAWERHVLGGGGDR